jgi:hypothetical protein
MQLPVSQSCKIKENPSFGTSLIVFFHRHQADEWLREVNPNAKKLEEHERKKERKHAARELKEKQERIKKAKEAREAAARAAQVKLLTQKNLLRWKLRH